MKSLELWALVLGWATAIFLAGCLTNTLVKHRHPVRPLTNGFRVPPETSHVRITAVGGGGGMSSDGKPGQPGQVTTAIVPV